MNIGGPHLKSRNGKEKMAFKNRSRLKLIQGGRRPEVSLGSARITLAPEDLPPFPVEAVVFEEDTFLVLSADAGRIESEDHPVVILTEAFGMEPEKPGSLLVYEGSPLRFLAIVHDLDQEPSWREEWIEKALEKVFQEAERRALKAIALPFLGTKHGSMDKTRFFRLLAGLLKKKAFPNPLRVWLVLPGDAEDGIMERLEADWKKG